jgi:hypothetical protein
MENTPINVAEIVESNYKYMLTMSLSTFMEPLFSANLAGKEKLLLLI